ncbi:MAG: hypothetical protein AAF927_28440, partial [Bacteroidota bacterium]
MKEKDALEQFIEAKLAEKQFSYQASYWDQAAGQMAAWEAEARRKRRFLWFSIFSGVLFISLATTAIFAFSHRGTPISQLEEAEVATSAISTSLLTDCDPSDDSAHDTAILSETTERSPQVSSSTPPSQGSRPSTTNHNTNRTTHTNNRTQTRNNTLLSAQNINSLASPKSGPLTTGVERSAQQLKKKYSLKKLLAKDYRLQALLDAAFSEPAEADQDRLSSFNLYVQSGAGFTASEMGESGSSLRGGQSTAQLGIRYNIRPGLALESGVQYHNTRLDNLSLSVTGRQFDFVAREQTIRWQVEQLHWISVPLHLSIRPLKRHELVLGASVDWLATSRGTLRQSQQDPFNPVSSTDLDGNGIVYGLRTFNYSAQLGYRFYVHPRMALDMRYRYGFRNLLDEEVWTA